MGGWHIQMEGALCLASAFPWSHRKARAQESTPLISLPQKVVDEIAAKLGIETPQTKQALAGGKIDLPDNVAVTITRKKTNEFLTFKKLRGGAEFEVTYRGTTTRITP